MIQSSYAKLRDVFERKIRCWNDTGRNEIRNLKIVSKWWESKESYPAVVKLFSANRGLRARFLKTFGPQPKNSGSSPSPRRHQWHLSAASDGSAAGPTAAGLDARMLGW